MKNTNDHSFITGATSINRRGRKKQFPISFYSRYAGRVQPGYVLWNAIVAAASLAVASSGLAQGVSFCGFDHQPIGQASLSITPEGYLSVAGMGPSGGDGVSVNLTPVYGTSYLWDADIDSPLLQSPSAFAGSALTLIDYATISGVPNQVISTETLTSTGSTFVFTDTFSSSASTGPLTVYYLSAGAVVAAYTVEGLTFQVSVPSLGDTTIGGSKQLSCGNRDDCNDWPPVQVVTPGGPLDGITGVEVVASAGNYSGDETTTIQGSGNLSSLVIYTETVTSPVPEPASSALFSIAAVSLLAWDRWRRKAKA